MFPAIPNPDVSKDQAQFGDRFHRSIASHIRLLQAAIIVTFHPSSAAGNVIEVDPIDDTPD